MPRKDLLVPYFFPIHRDTDAMLSGIVEVMGSNPVEALIFFFQASSFQLLKLENLLR